MAVDSVIDVQKVVADFITIMPNLSVGQLVLIQNYLLQESARRMYTQ